jgi:S-sulfo-L-cysteine synthase (3-phospho-L-serine-dependent)
MDIHQINRMIVDALVLPRIVQIEERLYAAYFQLMKLLPARHILDCARQAGLIRPGSVIIETTSGTFGIALAMLCALESYRLILVSDPAIDLSLKRRLEDLGTRVEIVKEPAAIGGYQKARLDRMEQVQREFPDHFCPSQYANPLNPRAYAPLAEFLTEIVGHIDYLVGTVGSGGSMCGTTSHLRRFNPDLQAIGVDTHGSVLFGQPDGKRLLRGLGNSLMPSNVNHKVFDEVHWVTAAEAFLATRVLHRSTALFMGGTSGAAYLVGRWQARRHPDARVVILLPDEGYRYQDTIYNDDWLKENNVWLAELPDDPTLVGHPLEVTDGWSQMFWGRRSYDELMNPVAVKEA